MTYTITVIAAILIHLILNYEFFANREEKNKANKAFKRYVWAAFAYFITDAIWGIIYEWHMPTLIYIDTIAYYLTMALTVVLMCRYVTTYLNLKSTFGRFINAFGLVFAIFEVVALVINHFKPIFFIIDSAGTYYAFRLRYVALYIQVLLCVLMAIQTGNAISKAIGEMKERYYTIFLFCGEMTIAILAQILRPLLPLYSVGLLIGFGIIHIFVKESEREAQYKVLHSLADINYSMHVIDLENDTVVEFNAKDEVKKIVNKQIGAAEMMVNVMDAVTVDQYKEAALSFTDLSTLAERMEGKSTISAQFIGKRTGWFLAMFIAIETDSKKRPTKVIYTTRVIDEEKKQEENLIYKSHTDELTGLYNRRAYEEDIYNMDDIPDGFIYIALDVNGLKVINDTIGHAAGDELIVGASICLQQVLGPYGRLYRTGGDEFVAIEIISEQELNNQLIEFERVVSEWSGDLVDSLSVSYGYVSKEECPEFTAPQFATEADKRMNKAKSAYYQKKGVDRRGQKDAHKALCDTYTKILKINISDDTHQVINMDEGEKSSDKGYSESISDWIRNFALSGQVHPEDVDEYIEKTSLSYLKEHFKNNKNHIVIYRRKYGDDYKRVMMEMIPANDFSDDNQTLFLYVKRIDE